MRARTATAIPLTVLLLACDSEGIMPTFSAILQEEPNPFNAHQGLRGPQVIPGRCSGDKDCPPNEHCGPDLQCHCGRTGTCSSGTLCAQPAGRKPRDPRPESRCLC